jgi:DMSO/TMAO reductase YedYZ heme-binding membrane subunit
VTHAWWYAARAGGIVSWALLAASVGWGLGLASHLFKGRGRPARMQDIHGYLGTLACVFVAVHVVGILADGWISFGLADVFVPFAADWHPLATAAGVVAFWLLVAVQLTSLARNRLPHQLWRRVHWASYALFGLATLHGLSTGSDTAGAVTAIAAFVVAALSGATAVRVMVRRDEAAAKAASPRQVLPIVARPTEALEPDWAWGQRPAGVGRGPVRVTEPSDQRQESVQRWSGAQAHRFGEADHSGL